MARLFLVLALLAAWQSALVHPLEHSDGRGGFVHLADGHDHEKQPSASGLCDVLAALAACAPDARPLFEADVSSQSAVPVHPGVPRVAEAPPFLSQGPPALLSG